MKKIKPLKAGTTAKRKTWKILILHSDRNEVRFHIHSGTLTLLYKNKSGLELLYEWAKSHNKTALMSISDEYRKRRLQEKGA